jgi:hypothetical protein
MKDPDGVYESIHEEAEAKIEELPKDFPISRSSVVEAEADSMLRFARQFLADGEYVCLEFDTEAGTCVVIPKG